MLITGFPVLIIAHNLVTKVTNNVQKKQKGDGEGEREGVRE